MKRSGDVHIEAINSENVKGSMQMTATGGGRTMNVNVGFTRQMDRDELRGVKQ